MNENIEEIEFTIFDTETTGLDPATGDRVVELAALRVKGDKRISEFCALVNPGREISPGAFAVNKISAQMLENAPGIEKIIPDFLKFIQGSCLCSYNAKFDLGFLNNELKLCGFPEIGDFVVFDILTMARRLLPGLERYPLWFVAQFLEIKGAQQHRALGDVDLTWEVFSRLKSLCREKGIPGFSNYCDLFAVNPGFLEQSNRRKSLLIQSHIENKKPLKLRYFSSHDATVRLREVLPRQLRQDYRHGYLIGYCCLKNEELTFRLDNILSFEEL